MEREEFDDIREEPEREIYRMLENDIQMNIRKMRNANHSETLCHNGKNCDCDCEFCQNTHWE